MHQILKNIIDAIKKDLRPQIGSVSAVHTVQMRFLAFSNAGGFLYGQMYRNPEQPDSGKVIADQVALNMVEQRIQQLLIFYQSMEKHIKYPQPMDYNNGMIFCRYNGCQH